MLLTRHARLLCLVLAPAALVGGCKDDAIDETNELPGLRGAIEGSSQDLGLSLNLTQSGPSVRGVGTLSVSAGDFVGPIYGNIVKIYDPLLGPSTFQVDLVFTPIGYPAISMIGQADAGGAFVDFVVRSEPFPAPYCVQLVSTSIDQQQHTVDIGLPDSVTAGVGDTIEVAFDLNPRSRPLYLQVRAGSIASTAFGFRQSCRQATTSFFVVGRATGSTYVVARSDGVIDSVKIGVIP